MRQAAVLALLPLLAGCIAPASGECSTVTARVDGMPVALFEGKPVPSGSHFVAYERGAMRYSPDQGWTVQVPEGYPGLGFHIVDRDGRRVLFLPGPASLTEYWGQKEVEQAGQGRDSRVTWKSGPMYVKLFDSPYQDNVAGTPNPTWTVCLEEGALAPRLLAP